ncbi:winged helix-turn-helix domain-containing protein [Actinomadura alba]|uniref:Winged helix-turn-helix transcriptional regulator n=1 Tax=Actinomadura alba TaxID=406431 RepID=A0ABR7LZ60_9ACTN|nr:winged helix-turn-helix domain-containing protein [Actinomadura alba]MBC6469663.1 winged helix-turn-helix transcriptional regulator [Actinomadura alba]
MSQPQLTNVIDLLARVRDAVDTAVEDPTGADPAGTGAPAGEHGTLLGVVPVPGTGTAVAIVAHLVSAIEGMALERPEPEPPGPAARDVVVDRATRRAWSAGRALDLTYLEFEMLAHLIARPGQVFSRRQLLASVWGAEYGPSARTVDVHVHRLRRKLGPHGHRLRTVRRVGYKYEPST